MKTEAEVGTAKYMGCAIMPWWMGCPKDVRNWAMRATTAEQFERADRAIYENDYCANVLLHDHSATVYGVRYREPGKPERVEWLTREAYCLRAVELLCDSLCRPLRLETRGGKWRIIASGQHGQRDIFSRVHKEGETATLQMACEDVLAQLDPLWKQ